MFHLIFIDKDIFSDAWFVVSLPFSVVIDITQCRSKQRQQNWTQSWWYFFTLFFSFASLKHEKHLLLWLLFSSLVSSEFAIFIGLHYFEHRAWNKKANNFADLYILRDLWRFDSSSMCKQKTTNKNKPMLLIGNNDEKWRTDNWMSLMEKHKDEICRKINQTLGQMQ